MLELQEAVVERGSFRLGAIDQDRGRFDCPERLLDTFVRESGLPPAEARTLLAKLALGADTSCAPAPR